MTSNTREKIIAAVVEHCLKEECAITIADLAESTGLAKSTVRRQAQKAVDLGLLEARDSSVWRGGYAPSFRWVRSYRPTLITMIRRLNIAEMVLGQAEYWLEKEFNDNPSMTEPKEILRVIGNALRGEGVE